MSNDLKWMLSSDQQFPYQDDKMIALWFKVMKWFKPDVVDYLGDTDDQACYSSGAWLSARGDGGAVRRVPAPLDSCRE